MPAAIEVTINNIKYKTKTEAMKALGISKPVFNRLIKKTDIDKALYEYLHPYGVPFKQIHTRLNQAISLVSRREKSYLHAKIIIETCGNKIITKQRDYVTRNGSLISWLCKECNTTHIKDFELIKRYNGSCGICSRSVTDPDGLSKVLAAIKRNNGKLVSKKKYINRYTRHDITCLNGHSFSLTANELINKNRWCAQCKGSPGETTARHILEILLHCKLPGPVRNIDWMIKCSGRNLELDGYNKCVSIEGFSLPVKLAFEYQGAQHYLAHWKGGYENLIKVQKRDKLKKMACIEEDVLLIEIPYFKESSNFEERVYHVKKILNKLKISYNKNISVEKPPTTNNSERLESLRKSLDNRGLKLLSNEYTGTHGKYEVFCPIHQYTWSAIYTDLHSDYRKPTGCTKCGRKISVNASIKARKRKYIEDLQLNYQRLKLAVENHGDILIETEYHGYNKAHIVQCGKCGYEWGAWPTSIHQGHFCKKCGQKNLITASREVGKHRSEKRHIRAFEAQELHSQGLSNSQIAKHLKIHERTVQKYLKVADG